jgi:hypothetical protein
MQTTMEGGCHCGRVRFRVTANFDRVSDCNCSICTKKGFLHLIVPPGQFQLVSGKDDLTTYEFNTKTAKHTFCKHCGIHPFYVPPPIRQDRRQRALSRQYQPCCDCAQTIRRKELGGRDAEARALAINALVPAGFLQAQRYRLAKYCDMGVKAIAAL